MNQIRTAK